MLVLATLTDETAEQPLVDDMPEEGTELESFFTAFASNTQLFDESANHASNGRRHQESAAEEVTRYMNDTILLSESVGALEYWRTSGQVAYPMLAGLAATYLAVPATSTASERLFSGGRQTTHYTRNKLSAHMLGVLMELRSWYKAMSISDTH